MRMLAAGVFACLVAAGPAGADVEKARQARLMWSAFSCATYAENMGDREEQRRLFDIGYEAGRTFLAAAEAGEISEQTWRTTVPIIVSMLTSGPSHDFMIGRVFENAMNDTYDKIAESIGGKANMISADYADVRRSAAGRLHLKNNCELID